MRKFLFLICSAIFLGACGQEPKKNNVTPVIQKKEVDTTDLVEVFKSANNASYKFTTCDSISIQQIKDSFKLNEKKYRNYYDRSFAAHLAKKELYDLIERLKLSIMEHVDESTDIEKMNHYMIGPDSSITIGKAKELRSKINNYMELMYGLAHEDEKKGLDLGMSTSNVYSSSEKRYLRWEIDLFYNKPGIAVITILSKLQNDALNAECTLLHSFLRSMKK